MAMPVLQVPELQWGSGILEFGKYNFYTAQRETTAPLFSPQAPNWAGPESHTVRRYMALLSVTQLLHTFFFLLLLNTIYCKMHKEQWNPEVVVLVCVCVFFSENFIHWQQTSFLWCHTLSTYSASNSNMKNHSITAGDFSRY